MTLDPVGPEQSIWPAAEWRLTPLRRGRSPAFPPHRPALLGFDDLHRSRAPLVVLGEEGSGLRSFCRCFRADLERRGETVIEVDLLRASGRDVEAMANASLGAGLKIEPSKTPVGLADRLEQFGDRRITLLFTGLSRPNFVSAASESLLSSIRGAVEARALPHVRFAFGAYEEDLFSTGEFSVFLEVCDVFKLAEWSVEDVVEVIRGTGIKDRVGLAERLVADLGGQPLLTRLVLEQLRHGNPDLDAVVTALVASPPSSTKRWHERLVSALASRPVLRSRFDAYLFGGDRSRPDAIDVPLYIMGWVGPTPSGAWGLRSEAHRTWARVSKDWMPW
jgi:hypothetical protein